MDEYPAEEYWTPAPYTKERMLQYAVNPKLTDEPPGVLDTPKLKAAFVWLAK